MCASSDEEAADESSSLDVEAGRTAALVVVAATRLSATAVATLSESEPLDTDEWLDERSTSLLPDCCDDCCCCCCWLACDAALVALVVVLCCLLELRRCCCCCCVCCCWYLGCRSFRYCVDLGSVL